MYVSEVLASFNIENAIISYYVFSG